MLGLDAFGKHLAGACEDGVALQIRVDHLNGREYGVGYHGDGTCLLVAPPLGFHKVGPDGGADHNGRCGKAEHQPQIGVEMADFERGEPLKLGC